MKSFGRYEILEELGRGGMGTVYLANLQKVSSIVSTEFRAKKKKTLKVEARSPGKAFFGLPPDAQLFVDLD